MVAKGEIAKTYKLDTQTYFTKTVEYLRTQPTRCVNEAGNCVLRNGKDNRCAVGYWIPDGHPSLSVTGSLSKLVEAHPELAGVAWPDTAEGIRLASALQGLHDYDRYRRLDGGGLNARGEIRTKEIAQVFNLTYRSPEETP